MSSRRRSRKHQCSSSSDDYELEDHPRPKIQRTARKNGRTTAEGEAPVRRPVWFWSEFNQWWRHELERLGKRPGKPSIVQWYEINAKRVWPDDTPSFQETRLHAKCLRSTEAVRDYFRRYRAARKEQQCEYGGDGQSNGGASTNAAAMLQTLSKQERHCSARHAAPAAEEPPMDPVALIEQHNQRIAEEQEQQTLAHAQYQPLLLPLPQQRLGRGDLPKLDEVRGGIHGNSDGGSVSSLWPGPAPIRALEGPVSGRVSRPHTRLDGADFSPLGTASRMDYSTGRATRSRLEASSPFPSLDAGPSSYASAAAPQAKSCATPIQAVGATPLLLQDWFASGSGQRSIGGSDGGSGNAHMGGRADSRVLGPVARADSEMSRQAREKRRSDRSSATDDGGAANSLHTGDAYDSEHNSSGTDKDEDLVDAVEDEDRWGAQRMLRRADTPFYRQGSLNTAVRENVACSEHQRCQLQEQQYDDIDQSPQYLSQEEWQQQQQQEQKQQLQSSRLSQQACRPIQVPLPLQLPPGDLRLLNYMPYDPYAPYTANIIAAGSCTATPPLLVRCGDAPGLVMLRQQQLQQQQHELLLQEQAIGCADSMSPNSLLIAAPPLPLMPLRADDWLLSPGAIGHEDAAVWMQPQPCAKKEDVHGHIVQQQLKQEHGGMFTAGGGVGYGGMAQIDEGMEMMEEDEETDDDDEGVPEVFWD